MIGTFAFLILRSARNQLLLRARRLRNPRYALALLTGLAYVWLVYLRPTDGRPRAQDMLGPVTVALLPLPLLLLVAWIWLSGGDRAALAFTPAEVAMLFTAPISRRSLMLYKLARAQLRIVTTSIVWTLVFRETGTPAIALAHVAGYWALLSTINAHRLGVALVHASAGDHGLRGARRNWIAIAVFVVIVGMVAAPVVMAWPALRAAEDLGAATRLVAEALTTAPASWALAPFHVLLAPLSTPLGLAWLARFGVAVLLWAGMVAWVLGTDAAFEETAAEASAAQARRIDALRARRGATLSPLRNPARRLPLAPTGIPAIALLWKNATWLLRSGALRGLLLPPLIGLLCAAALAPRSEVASITIAVGCGALAAILLVAGPLSMRNDLRSELLHLPLLKTLPLRGRDVVMAEVASGALPMAATQWLLAMVALFSLSFSARVALPGPVALAAAIAAVPVLLGLNGAVFTIHNAMALLFPGWVRLGTTAAAGIETLGLGLINVTLSLVMLGLLVLVPAAVGAGLAWMLRIHLPLALLLGGVVAGSLLLAECAACAAALGGSLERIEPLHVES